MLVAGIKIDNTSQCSDSSQMSFKLLKNQSMREVGGIVFVLKFRSVSQEVN